MGTLYVVATPIGNLEDITLRALRILEEVDLVAAEDTRTTGVLLSHYEIDTPMTSYHEHTSSAKRKEVLRALQGGDVALVSDAGMPGISDPGYHLIREAIEADVPVVPIPGPTALVTAVAVSGLPTDSFVYLGFLPRRQKERQELLRTVAQEKRTLVAFESPYRVLDSLRDLQEMLGDRQIAVARELTKMHEELWRGPISGAIDRFEGDRPRGEFTLVVAGSQGEEDGAWSEEKVRRTLNTLREEGLRGKEAVKQVARLAKWPSREVYDVLVKIKHGEG